ATARRKEKPPPGRLHYYQSQEETISQSQMTVSLRKFEQWQFWIQQYLQHEHYALWEVIEFGDSYEVLASTASATITDTTSGETDKKSGRRVTLTTKDMQKKKNDAKARTTLLLSLHDEHQLRFTEGSETSEQTFNRLQVIVGQLQFMDVEIEQDNLNQKFLTYLAPEWLMHTIVWRNRSDLDTMSLDDLSNHLKVYESEVQKKLEPNSQNMAFISLAKHSSGNEDGNTACVPAASTNVPTASASVATISQDTACAYIASQSSGLPEAMTEEGETPSDKEDHELVADEEAPTEFSLMANTSTESKVFDNSLCSKDCKKNNDSLNSKIIDLTDKLFDAKNMIYNYKLGLSQVESRLVEHKDREIKYCEKIRGLGFRTESNNECIEILKKKLEILKKENEGVDRKLAGFLTASKDLDNVIESQRTDKNKDGLGYSAVPPPPAQIYSSPKKDFTSGDDQNINPSISETEASPSAITPKPCIKFIKASDSPTESKIDKAKKAKKSPVKFTWTFFLKSKDETSGILKKFIAEIENLKDIKLKIIRCDNGGEFRNKEMNDFCSHKGIKREFSNARTPQQNGVAERRNRTLIEAARTMLADAKLLVTFWAEAVNTACYV
nr:putative ribonuclease H-like domain-containing protein [Tanacetum cinerariifolium]